MATQPSKDAFANYAIITVLEPAANTLVFKKLETGISLTEKVAWIINRIEYWYPEPSTLVFDGDSDSLYFGLSLSNSWSTPDITQTTIIDINAITKLHCGAPANAFIYPRPLIKSFADLPGGGILVPPTPLYLWAKGAGLLLATQTTARIHYTLRALAIDEYWELVEARRVLSS